MAPACDAGSFDCRTTTIIQRCRPGRDALDDIRTCMTGSTCDEEPLPATGQPECVVCEANAYRCDGELLRCSSDGLVEAKVYSCPAVCNVAPDGTPSCE
jgi:hypothetical protein